MDKKSINEMEQIQRGLEAFLEQELADLKGGETAESPEKETKKQEEKQAEKQAEPKSPHRMASDEDEEDSYWQDWDAKEEETDQREEVEDFLKQNRHNRGLGQKDKSSSIQTDRTKGTGKTKRKGTKGARQKETGSPRQKGTESTGRKGTERTGRKGAEGAGQKVKKKRSGLKKFLAVVLVLAALLSFGWYSLIGIVYDKMTFEENTTLATQPMKEDGVVNILLIGNDSRENGEDGRSDAMILLSVNSRAKTIYMTSFLRDIYVDIPGHDGNRLNAAYSFGGPELLLATLEQNFDIHVNRYMLVNFQAFANLVDAVGGVDLELTSEEVEYINGYLVEYNMLTGQPEGTDYMDTSKSGMLHINGPQALAYSRNRYLGTDFGRTERQRKVLSAVMAKAPSALLTNPKGLLDVLSNLTTNLTQGECMQLSLMAGKLLTYTVVQDSIPVQGSYENAKVRGMAVLKIDFDKNKQHLQDTVYGKAPKAAENRESVK